MLTGRPPFPEGTVLQKLLSHSTEDPTDPRMFRPDLDDQIVRTLQRLLAKQPAQRYQRASELISHLLLVAERLNLGPVARNGLVSHAPRNSFAALLLRSLPWALPTLLFIMVCSFSAGCGIRPSRLSWRRVRFGFRQPPRRLPSCLEPRISQPTPPEVGEITRAPVPEPRGEQPVPPSPQAPNLPRICPDKTSRQTARQRRPRQMQNKMPCRLLQKSPRSPLMRLGSSASQPRLDAPDSSGPDTATPDMGALKPEAPVDPQVDSPSPPAPPSVAPAPPDSTTPPAGSVAPPPGSVPPAEGPPQQEPPSVKAPGDPSAVVAQEVTKIVVSDHQKKLEDGILSVSSLAAACREATGWQ
jgi:serine/threonine protein kinase